MPGAAPEVKRRVVAAAERCLPRWRELALRIHAHPELGLREHQASAWLSGALAEEGFRVQCGVGGLETSFEARQDSVRAAPAVAFLAEYDALPGLGHACSHNLMGAAACLAAVALAQGAGPAAGPLRVLGTPAEEGYGGKIHLAERGAFSGVDAVLMAHGGARHYGGKDFLGVKTLTLEFHGKTAHAAAFPHQGLNALDAVVQTYVAVSLLRQQLKDGSRVHGIITHGGQAPNIIPDFASAEFFVRSFDADYLEELDRRVLACARGAAEATGTCLEVKRGAHAFQPSRRNPALERQYEENLRFLGVEPDPPPPGEGTGSTDFGNVSQLVPGIHAYFKIAPAHVRGHTKEFAAASRSEEGLAGMLVAAKALALTALDLWEDPGLWARVRSDFDAAPSGGWQPTGKP